MKYIYKNIKSFVQNNILFFLLVYNLSNNIIYCFAVFVRSFSKLQNY